jgi:hypothetical protein
MFLYLRSLYHEYKKVYKKKLLYDQRGIDYSSTALKIQIRDIEDKMELSSILIAREHARAEVKFRSLQISFF